MKSQKRLNVFNITILLIIIGLFQSLNAQLKRDKIDSLVSYYNENGMFNGSILIAEKSDIVLNKSYGFSDLKTKKELTLNTPSNIGSVSKQFTAMGIMILFEQGKLSLNDKLFKYFPQIINSNSITIKQLLNHTSGLPRLNTTLEGVYNMEGALNYFESIDSVLFMPGEAFSYSNVGYILLAMIIEKISGQSYSDFMTQNIFHPLKMNNTWICNESNYFNKYRAKGFDQYGEIYDDSSFIYGQGGIYSTVNDLFKWDQCLYSEELISNESLKEVFSPGKLNDGSPSRKAEESPWGYGFGWLLRKNDLENIVWHDGGINGFSSIFYRDLNKKRCIVILSNMGEMGSNAPVYSIHKAILKILDGQQVEFPKIPISVKIKNMIDQKGIDFAIVQYNTLKTNFPAKYDFSERQLNQLGYFYLNKNRYKEAIPIFKLNTEVFPNSANVYDSLGEAYMVNGQKDLAIKNYKKSLELNSGNENAKEMLRLLNN